MLFQPPPEPPNPYAPFVYRDGEIRHVGDLGDRYEADVWLTRTGWRWSASVSTDPIGDGEYGSVEFAGEDDELATEAQATEEAVAWLRARCVAVHGRCG